MASRIAAAILRAPVAPRRLAPAATSSRGIASFSRGAERVAPAAADRSFSSQVAFARLPAAEPALAPELQLQLNFPHNIWSEHSFGGVQTCHMRPGSLADSAAFGLTRVLAGLLDASVAVSRSRERSWLRRLLLLSVLSGAPGRALACSKGAQDQWSSTLMKEACQERARLMVLLQIRAADPSLQRVLLGSQAALAQGFLVARRASPRFCRWLGVYAEEEQIKAYTGLLEDFDAGRLPGFSAAAAPPQACARFGLPEGSSLRAVFRCLREEGMLSR